jgi:hypothetical protein
MSVELGGLIFHKYSRCGGFMAPGVEAAAQGKAETVVDMAMKEAGISDKTSSEQDNKELKEKEKEREKGRHAGVLGHKTILQSEALCQVCIHLCIHVCKNMDVV